MSKQLHPDLDDTLSTLGANPIEKGSVLGFLLNSLASAEGQVARFDNAINNLQTQRAIAREQVIALQLMVDKFTVDVEETLPESPVG